MEDKIIEWKNLTDKITASWIVKYFDLEKETVSDIDYFWVADDIGGVFEFADYYFDFNTVLKCYELDISTEQLFDWYYFCLDNHSVNISLAKYVKNPQERREQEEKHLLELKERVKSAQEEFDKALENYGK